jgi:hypothetical protein
MSMESVHLQTQKTCLGLVYPYQLKHKHKQDLEIPDNPFSVDTLLTIGIVIKQP